MEEQPRKRGGLAVGLILTGLTLLCGAILAYEIISFGQPSAATLVATALLSGFALAWPFVHKETHAVAAGIMCRDCGGIAPYSRVAGFCIQCGSTRLSS